MNHREDIGVGIKGNMGLISVLVYAIILHLRFIPKLKNKYVFNVCSMFAIWTIIMTYFGVKFIWSAFLSQEILCQSHLLFII